MLYHFEFHREHAWEAFGSGEGSGPEAIALALADLRRLAGGELPAGEYRCIAAGGASARWESLRLGEGGRIMVERASSACEQTAGHARLMPDRAAVKGAKRPTPAGG